jgi:ribulose-phosphate 3-epimerase
VTDRGSESDRGPAPDRETAPARGPAPGGVRIAPSLLSADFANLAEAVRLVEEAGVSLLHVDVMDGHFVPNITIGPFVIEAIRRVAKSQLDVHLMIEEPGRYLERFVRAGSDYITFHVEAVPEALDLVKRAKSLGARAGVALNPATPLGPAEPVFEIADLIVVMTVNPGFGGQGFMAEVVPKIRRLYELKSSRNYGFEIEVDGGIGIQTAPVAAWAGADVLVAGAAVYGSPDPKGAVRAIAAAALRGLAERANPQAFPLAPS